MGMALGVRLCRRTIRRMIRMRVHSHRLLLLLTTSRRRIGIGGWGRRSRKYTPQLLPMFSLPRTLHTSTRMRTRKRHIRSPHPSSPTSLPSTSTTSSASPTDTGTISSRVSVMVFIGSRFLRFTGRSCGFISALGDDEVYESWIIVYGMKLTFCEFRKVGVEMPFPRFLLPIHTILSILLILSRPFRC